MDHEAHSYSVQPLDWLFLCCMNIASFQEGTQSDPRISILFYSQGSQKVTNQLVRFNDLCIFGYRCTDGSFSGTL
jgi:hypothetical protein